MENEQTQAPMDTGVGPAEGPATEQSETWDEEERSLVTAGQRRINVIWEVTQSTISIGITVAVGISQLMQIETPILDYSFFLIVGFYFSRTNHANVGGVGPKAKTVYRGR